LIYSNIFPAKEEISKLSIPCTKYRVLNLPTSEELRSKSLKGVARRAGTIVGFPVGDAITTEGAFLLVPELSKKQKQLPELIDAYPLKEEDKADLSNFPYTFRDMLFDFARNQLESYGFWRGAYNTYYEYAPEKTINNVVSIYRGLWFRFDLVKSRFFLTVDPVCTLTSCLSLWEQISKEGFQVVKKKMEKGGGQRVLQRHYTAKKKSICRIHSISQELSVSKKSFKDKQGRLVSVKENIQKCDPILAGEISDDEPTVLLTYDGKKIYHTAPSLLWDILLTNEVPIEVRDIVKREVYLAASVRRKLTQKYRAYLSEIKVADKSLVSFKDNCLSSKDFKCEIFEPPSLRFGEQNLKPKLEELRGFKKKSLRNHGPAKKIEIAKSLIIVHPFLPMDIVSGLISDFKKIARNYFKMRLPYIHQWKYNDVLDEDTKRSLFDRYKRFKSRIEGAIVVIEKEDPKYFFFKELFQDIPTQMITKETIEVKFSLPPEKMGKYWNKILNACSGLLTKMGVRPWILGDPLTYECYAGLEVGEGDVFCHFYVYDKHCQTVGVEPWRPQKGEAVSARNVSEALKNSVEKVIAGKINSLVVHRDGRLTNSEKQGIKEAVNELMKKGKLSDNPIVVGVNIKKAVPFRFYDVTDKEEGCKVGTYMILNDKQAIVATTGVPLLRQGTAKPILIEIEPILGDASIESIAQDVYNLSHMNWGSILMKLKLPITIAFAEKQTPMAQKGIPTRFLPI